MKKIFAYGKLELDYLQSRDEILGKFIDKIGFIERTINDDLFQSLVEAIVAQQISGKAAETVYHRLEELVDIITPENIITCSDLDFQKCGLSWRKVNYIKDFSLKILNKELDLELIPTLPDDEVIKILDDLKGFGPWTAEMFLIFALGRKNVLSFNDFGIQKGLRLLYHHRKITPALFAKYKKRYSPYATIASFYLWEIAAGDYGLKDYQIRKNVKNK